MALAPLLLAATLAQACPSPASPGDPPPCIVADVPGCLPGYRPLHDRFGRLIYACDPKYVSAPAEAPSPPREYAPQVPTQAAVTEGRGHLAVVFMPGVSAFPSYTQLNRTSAEVQFALELRGTSGGGRLRLTGEYTTFGRLGELSAKYDFFDRFAFRPFLALGLGIGSVNPDPTLRGLGSASVGIDLYLGRNFFLTGELRGRLFTAGTTQGQAHGLSISDQRQTSVLAGMGFYLF